MRPDLSVVYYTNNKENPAFEGRIRQTLLETMGDLPLISVSQKPMDFGKNICVGDVGSSSQNAWRQFIIGAKEAKTKYVCTAEADFIYSPEYFQFRPPQDDALFIALPMYVLTAMRGIVCVFCPKRMGSLGAAVANRERLVFAMEQTVLGLEKWGNIDENEYTFNDMYKYLRRDYFRVKIPIVSIKTDQGTHRATPRYQGKTREIPYWGKSHDLVRRYV